MFSRLQLMLFKSLPSEISWCEIKVTNNITSCDFDQQIHGIKMHFDFDCPKSQSQQANSRLHSFAPTDEFLPKTDSNENHGLTAFIMASSVWHPGTL